MARPSALAPWLALALLGALAGPAALAQPRPPGAPPPAAAPPPAGAPTPAAPAAAPADGKPADEPSPEVRKDEARRHFEKGLALTRDNAWAPALAEFLQSRRLYPTRTATQNAALVLQRLQRFDEALDLFEALLRDFPTLPPDDKAQAQRAVIDLRALVATLDIGGAEPGATIAVDGRARGDYPPPAPLRVPAGTHVVRVYKEGYEPFEARVDAPGGEATRIKARMHALTLVGRLKVSEQAGLALDVVVDGIVVGRTPWEGPLSPGQHTVVLRGEGLLGTQPARAPVLEKQLTPLVLRAEELEGSLQVDPTPAGASIAVDSVVVGLGYWEGRLRKGTHRVEVTADGFIPQTREIELSPGKQGVVSVQLQRDRGAGLGRLTRVAFEVQGNAAIAPSLGGDVAGGCTGGCAGTLGLGALFWLHGGYRFGSGVGLGVSAGYMFATQRLRGRAGPGFTPTGLPTQGTADDDLRLGGVLVGGHLSYRRGERTPVTFRLGAGALLGTLRDQRNGHFTTSVPPPHAYDTGLVEAAPGATYVYVDPELRLGWQAAEHVELSAGVQALLLFAVARPRWDGTQEVYASSDGIGTYRADTLTGGLVVVVVPGIGARYEF